MSTKWLEIPSAKKFVATRDGATTEVLAGEFWRPQKVMARLHHPNVIKFFCCGKAEREGQYFIGKELMETDLSACIRRWKGRPFPIVVALDIIVQIARGMRYLHSQGIAHRDLKPRNVLISTTELGDIFCVKIAGFGICTANVEASRSEETPHLLGTMGHMAPEFRFARSGLRLQPFKADIFGFTTTSSEVLFFKQPPPLGPPNPRFRDYMGALEEGVRPEFASRCPKELVALLRECWDIDPELRPTLMPFVQDYRK